jgi:hypothetical protein
MLLPVRAALLVLQVTALALGRLYAKLDADTALGHLLLPLLADLLHSCSDLPPPPAAAAGAVPGGAAAAAARGQLGSSGGAVPALPAAHAAAADGQPLPAEVAGAVVCTLEGMASACVQHGREPWLYEQSLQVLLTMYRDPTPVRWWPCVCVCAV